MKNPNRSGVAMFVVLGAIVLVTMLGFAGMEMAHKDQTLALDVQDLRSRESAMNAAFQLAINRITSQPAIGAAALDTFLTDQRKAVGNPRTWLKFDADTLQVVVAKPNPFAIGAGGADETAVQVKIEALMVKPDEGATIVTFRATVQGRHGDQQDGIASFRIQGIGAEYKVSTARGSFPMFAAYIGTRMASGNTRLDIQGGAYVGASNSGTDVGLNSGASMTVTGVFKWNGVEPYSLNATQDVTFADPAYFRNGIKFNSNGRVFFNAPTMVDGPIAQLQGTIVGRSFLWIKGGNCPPLNGGVGCICNGGSLAGARGLMFQNVTGYNKYPMTLESNAGNIYLGGQFRDLLGGTSSFSGRISANGDLVMLGTAGLMNWDFKPASISVLGNLMTQRGANSDLRIDAPVGAKFGGMSVSSLGLGTGIFDVTGGTVTYSNSPTPAENPDTIKAKTPARLLATTVQRRLPLVLDPVVPTLEDFGIPAWLRAAQPVDNPPDSIWVRDTGVTAPIYNSLRKWSSKFGADNILDACKLNAWWKQDSIAGTLFNGYLPIAIDMDLSVDNNCGQTALHGKYLFVIRKIVTVNAKWPLSQTKNDIQVVSVEGAAPPGNAGGRLVQWGFQGGIFAGIVFWDDPDGASNEINMDFPNFPAGDFNTIFGAITLTQSRTNPTAWFHTNGGRLRVVKDMDVFRDVAANLPGVMKPGRDAPGNDNGGQRTWFTITTTSPSNHLSLLTSELSSQPLGAWR